MLEDSGARTVIIEDGFLDRLPLDGKEGLLDHVIVVGAGGLPENHDSVRFHDWNVWWQNESDADIDWPVNDRDLMQILYTSGTTSQPKGVMMSHLAVYLESLGTAFECKNTEKDIGLAMLPFYHSQFNAFLTPLIIAGGKIVIMKKFDPVECMRLIHEQKVTQMLGLPMMYRMLIEHPERKKYDLSSLRLCIYAMAPMPDRDLRLAIETFACDFALVFGQTEMAPVAVVFRPEHQLVKPGAVGTPSINVEVGVMDERGELLPANQVGEIVYRSPQAMEGYLGDHEKTTEAFAHGWFHSGDSGYLDEDALLWFVDRKKDMVKTGGVNVSSIEVEKVIFMDQRIQNVAVVGLPHAHWSEALTAFVIPKAGEIVTEEEVLRFCKSQLGGYKVPKRVVILDQFPMTATGKIQKHLLRREHEQLYSRAGVD